MPFSYRQKGYESEPGGLLSVERKEGVIVDERTTDVLSLASLITITVTQERPLFNKNNSVS